MKKKRYYKKMKGDDRKNQILQVALHVFAEDNYYNATNAKIAKEADISEPTIYLYFKNKKDLFISVIEHCASFRLNALKQILDEADDLKQATLNLIRLDYEFITQVTPDIDKIMIMARVINDSEIKACVRKCNTDIYELVIEYIEKGMAEGLIRDDVGPDVLARILMGMIEGMTAMLLLDYPGDVDSTYMAAFNFLEKFIFNN